MARRASRRRAKRETYYDRWRKEHVRVSFYFDRGEYERLKEFASSKNMTVKELVVSLMEGFEKYRSDIAGSRREQALQAFLECPALFSHLLEAHYPGGREKLQEGVAFFTLPCSICGKPMVFSHMDVNWETEIKPVLLEAFKEWCHPCCIEVEEGKRGSCEHLSRPRPSTWERQRHPNTAAAHGPQPQRAC
jgi:hypothetical protein